MANLPEVPTDELLSFQDYPTVHIPSPPNQQSQPQLNLDLGQDFGKQPLGQQSSPLNNPDDGTPPISKSFWTLEYYQQFFDIDTQDVIDRILASITPRSNNRLKQHLREKPDLYGPLWISITLIFTIAISGNIADYLQHAQDNYKWKYDFHLVSYAATTICIYVTCIPFALWGLLKWSSDINDLDGLEDGRTPSVLELICIYGYSLFIYIPVSIFWAIQINLLQWSLVLIAVSVSGSVLLFTLMPALKLSRHKLLLTVGIICCHLLLAAGFKLYFFHAPHSNKQIIPHIIANKTNST